jgi:hypothetical protein
MKRMTVKTACERLNKYVGTHARCEIKTWSADRHLGTFGNNSRPDKIRKTWLLTVGFYDDRFEYTWLSGSSEYRTLQTFVKSMEKHSKPLEKALKKFGLDYRRTLAEVLADEERNKDNDKRTA